MLNERIGTFNDEEWGIINCIWGLIGVKCDEYEALEIYEEIQTFV